MTQTSKNLKWFGGATALVGAPLLATGFLYSKSSDGVDNNLGNTAVQNCKEDGTSQLLDSKSEQNLSDFENDFATAREAQGPGGLFFHKGGIYNTYYKEEWTSLSKDDKENYLASINIKDSVQVNHHGEVINNIPNGAVVQNIVLPPQEEVALNDYDPEIDQDLAEMSNEIDQMDTVQDPSSYASKEFYNEAEAVASNESHEESNSFDAPEFSGETNNPSSDQAEMSSDVANGGSVQSDFEEADINSDVDGTSANGVGMSYEQINDEENSLDEMFDSNADFDLIGSEDALEF